MASGEKADPLTQARCCILCLIRRGIEGRQALVQRMASLCLSLLFFLGEAKAVGCPTDVAEAGWQGRQTKGLHRQVKGLPVRLTCRDEVRMPELNAYKDSESFYATLYHELAHSTGHQSRLNRPGVAGTIKFGSQDYSEEELVAEICASFLCAYTQIENKVIDNSMAYLNSWISKLSNDKFMIIKAASAAQKAFNLITKGGSI